MNQTELQQYEYENLPLRDKINLNTKRLKHDFISHYPEMVRNLQKDHHLFFFTVTFLNPNERPYDEYRKFFMFFRRKLDRRLLYCLKKNIKKPKLILFPEQTPRLHFHGILALHKDTFQKFMSKCVDKIEHEMIDVLEETRPCLHLNSFLINPYPTDASFQNPLLIDGYKLYPILSDEDLKRTMNYSHKRFLQSSFTDDQTILEWKPDYQIP